MEVSKALTKKQAAFVAEYQIDLNATQAAIRAGYSPKQAHKSAAQLMAKPHIKAAIDDAQAKRLQRLDITADAVLQELAKIGFHDPGKMFNQDGTVKAINELDDNTRMAIAGFEVSELFDGDGDERRGIGFAKKIKLADKRAALVDLGRHLKLFTDKIESTGTLKVPLAIWDSILND
jgi:phage terminase small subunit